MGYLEAPLSLNPSDRCATQATNPETCRGGFQTRPLSADAARVIRSVRNLTVRVCRARAGLKPAPTGILVVRNRSAAPDLFVTTPAYKPNTYSMDAVAVCLSSGDVLMMLLLCREPARTAMNCLPFTE